MSVTTRSTNPKIMDDNIAKLDDYISDAIELPSVTGADNGKTLQVVNGAWATGDDLSSLITKVNGINAVTKIENATSQSVPASTVTKLAETENNLPEGKYLCVTILNFGGSGASPKTHNIQLRFSGIKSFEEQIIQAAYSTLVKTFTAIKELDGNIKGSVEIYDSVATTITSVTLYYVKLV